MEQYQEAGDRGLPTAVVERLGVSVRTAHRYIAAVRAEDDAIQVPFSTTEGT